MQQVVKIEVFSDPSRLFPQGATSVDTTVVGSLKVRRMTVEGKDQCVIEGPNGEYLHIDAAVELS